MIGVISLGSREMHLLCVLCSTGKGDNVRVLRIVAEFSVTLLAPIGPTVPYNLMQDRRSHWPFRFVTPTFQSMFWIKPATPFMSQPLSVTKYNPSMSC
jgi:hypothetical protein